jgi:hypothetical protein
MQEYRAYLLDKSGRISQAAIIIRETTDEVAIAVTKQLLDTHDIDLWQGTRRIVTLKAGRFRPEACA